MKPDPEVFRKILLNAQQALQRGERHTARRWAERAVEMMPDSEEAWLILAAVASPRASMEYLQKALAINPNSQRAQKGLAWAKERLLKQQASSSEQSQVTEPDPRLDEQDLAAQGEDNSEPAPQPHSPRALSKVRLLLLALLVVVICIAAAWEFLPVNAAPVWAFLHDPQAGPGIAGILADVIRPSETPTMTATPLATATFTPTPTLTATPTPTNTATATDTAIPTDTATPTMTLAPTDTSLPTATKIASTTTNWTDLPAGMTIHAPDGITAGSGMRWIDVNLSKQTLDAVEGTTVVRSFLVSTGVSQFPTVTGQFHIYVKYLYTLMHGDNYYLPNVPYTMYFYKSYGIHGTYWHHNFGHRMSHGCVNMYTPDAEWMYYWASVGTLVNIHY